jgi:hypothetical protein
MVSTPEARAVTPQTVAKKSLVAIGVALIVLFVAGAVLARTVGNTSKETSSAAATTAGSAQATSKTTTTKDWPSDTLLSALLGTGAALVLVGLLYSRITTIKLPGGSEIDLSPDEKKKVAEKVAKKVQDKAVNPEEAPQITVAAVETLRREKTRAGFLQMPDDKVDQAVDAAIENPSFS